MQALGRGPTTATAARAAVTIFVLSSIFSIIIPARAEVEVSTAGTCPENLNDDSTRTCSEHPTTRNQIGILRIPASTHANFMQRIPCLDKIHRNDSQFLPERRKSSRSPSYTTLPCAPEPSSCFRAVYDGYEDLLDLPDWNKERDKKLQPIVESLIVLPENAEGKSGGETEGILAPGQSRTKTYDDKNVGGRWGFDNYGQMHVDYFEQKTYVYTAILYEEPSEDFLGGETLIVDAGRGFSLAPKDDESEKIDRLDVKAHLADKRRRMRLESGVIIEPKKGRLVLFTSGAENVHAPLKVEQGSRDTFHAWFKCAAEGQ